MKITIEHEGVTASVEQEAYTFHELAELFEQCAVGVGFSAETVEDYYKECAVSSLVNNEKKGMRFPEYMEKDTK